MRWLRRAKEPQRGENRSTGTDIQKISSLVHERRRERIRNSKILRENPESAEAIARTYRPESHLRSVHTKTKQLVQDAVDIPRTWDQDPPPVTARSIRRPYRPYIVFLCINVLMSLLDRFASDDEKYDY